MSFKSVYLETAIPEIPNRLSIRENGNMFFNGPLISDSKIMSYQYIKVGLTNGKVRLIYSNQEELGSFRMEWNERQSIMHCKFLMDYLRRFYKAKAMQFSIEKEGTSLILTKID